jgi:uncharacterized membrane protein (DUF4010 family)
MTDFDAAINVAVAALTGLAVGIEREWSGHASGPQARFAGVRTFLLLGLIAGAAGWLSTVQATAVAVAVIAVTGLLVVAAYWTAAQRGPEAVDGTTEVAALAVLVLGFAAGMGWLRLASGAAAVIVLALGRKQAVHRFVARIGEHEMRAALQFAVLALVVLPLLPEGPYGPYGAIRPRSLWTVVLLFSALNFAGYLARRAVGERRGYPVVGALGGLLSSTAVTLGFARQSQRQPDDAPALAIGAIAAGLILFPRVLVISAVLNSGVALFAALWLAPLIVTALIILGVLWRREPATTSAPTAEPDNPLRLWAAIRMALAFQVVLIAIEVVGAQFGKLGVLTGAAVIGLTDVDALTLSMSRLGATEEMVALAAEAILVGIVANCLLKAAIAVVFGSRGYARRVAPALLILGLIGTLELVVAEISGRFVGAP